MKLRSILIMILTSIVSPLVSHSAFASVNTIDCKYVESYSATYNGKKWEVDHEKSDSTVVTFTELNSDNPKLVGNAGMAQLKKINVGAHVYLIEPTPFGNVNMWTYSHKMGC